MTTVARGRSAAFTYAWWLTGDEDSAARALRTALADTPPNGADPFAGLLQAVRSAAISAPTMCPASELALLHDAAGLTLDAAATLTGIDVDEARAELAHGRLEALLDAASEPFDHPERLGGLAVGNPPDIAHARQCPSCEHARELLLEGRRELTALPAPAVPSEIVDLLPPLPAPTTAPPAEADTEEQRAAPAARPRRRSKVVWSLSAAAAVLAIAAVVIANSRLVPTPDPAPAPEPDPPAAAPAAPAEEPEAIDPTGPFNIEDAGVLVAGASDPASGVQLDPEDALRLVVRYRGAADGVVVVGHWTVDTEPFLSLRSVLTATRSAHVFGVPAPEGGWPPGGHQILLTVDGEVVAAVDFTVP